MFATSPAQFAASESGTVPPLEEVRPDVWSLGIAMPAGHLPYSLLTVLRDSDGAIHLFDPGWDTDANLVCIESALATLRASLADIRSITATHLHPDHLGLAGRIRSASGAPIQLHVLEQAALEQQGAEDAEALDSLIDGWNVPDERRPELLEVSAVRPPQPVIADRLLSDGERLDIPGFEVEVMHTPGHTAGHISFRDDFRSLILTGDHLLPTVFAGLGLGGLGLGGLGSAGPATTNPLADYLAALARISEYPGHEVLPGHGYRFSGLAERAAQSAEHHLRRSREVAAALTRAPGATTWQVASELTWTAGWHGLRGFTLFSALAQTDMHRGYLAANS